MDIYRTEEEQVEALKKWWQENGKSIVAGLVIGFSAIFGWRAWQDHIQTHAEAASSEYQHMIVAVQQNDNETARKHAQSILDGYQSTSYARFAELLLARLAVEDKDYQKAEEFLQQVISKSSSDQIKHIARLRLARVFLSQDRLKEAEALVNTSDKGKFLAEYEEVRGDIFIRQGMTDAARDAYRLALANSEASEQDRAILQIKMDVLGAR